MKTKRLLKKISFDFDGAHLAYTDASQGGACSLMNDPIMLKALNGKTLTKEQKAILESAGHNILDVEKSASECKKSSTSDSEGVEVDNFDNSINKGNEDAMSQETLDRVAQLEKALAVSEAKNTISPYNLGDLAKSVAEALASISEDSLKESITKAFDHLIEAGKQELEAAVEKAKEAQEAAATKTEDENPLVKALNTEAGDAGEPEAELEKELSRSEKIAKFLNSGDKV